MTKKHEREVGQRPQVGEAVVYVPHKDHHTDVGAATNKDAWPAVVVEEDTPEGKRLVLEIRHPGGDHVLHYPLDGEGAVPHDKNKAPHSWHRQEGE